MSLGNPAPPLRRLSRRSSGRPFLNVSLHATKVLAELVSNGFSPLSVPVSSRLHCPSGASSSRDPSGSLMADKGLDSVLASSLDSEGAALSFFDIGACLFWLSFIPRGCPDGPAGSLGLTSESVSVAGG